MTHVSTFFFKGGTHVPADVSPQERIFLLNSILYKPNWITLECYKQKQKKSNLTESVLNAPKLNFLEEVNYSCISLLEKITLFFYNKHLQSQHESANQTDNSAFM